MTEYDRIRIGSRLRDLAAEIESTENVIKWFSIPSDFMIDQANSLTKLAVMIETGEVGK